MAAFKLLEFDASLFEETPNRSNFEISKLVLSLMFSPTFLTLSKSALLSSKKNWTINKLIINGSVNAISTTAN